MHLFCVQHTPLWSRRHLNQYQIQSFKVSKMKASTTNITIIKLNLITKYSHIKAKCREMRKRETSYFVRCFFLDHRVPKIFISTFSFSVVLLCDFYFKIAHRNTKIVKNYNKNYECLN